MSLTELVQMLRSDKAFRSPSPDQSLPRDNSTRRVKCEHIRDIGDARDTL